MLILFHGLAGSLTQPSIRHLKFRTCCRRFAGKSSADEIASLNSTVTRYMKDGLVETARKMFDEMPQRDVVSWNAMLSGYAQNGRLRDAREIFDRMPQRDIVSWNAMIMGCVRNLKLVDARKLFDEMPERNVISWNLLIRGYVNESHIDIAEELFRTMPKRDFASWTIMISAFSGEGRISDARQLFEEMPKRDAQSWNAMIAGYVKNGRVEIAEGLFAKMPGPDACSWLELITGYISYGRFSNAIEFFFESPKKLVASWNFIVMGLIDCELLEVAHALFEKTPWKHMVSWTNLVVAYFDVGDVRAARRLFDAMLDRDEVTWNAAIAGYSKNELGEEGLSLYLQMHGEGLSPDSATFVSVLSIISSLPSLDCGRQTHGQIIKSGFDSFVAIGNAVITMYARCGSISSSLRQFKYMPNHDVISWNSVICGYAQHGSAKEALDLFEKMRLTSAEPNEITFVSVLNVCSRAGLVDKGRDYFYLMTHYYRIKPTSEHYTSIVDLLGRFGFLDDALNIISKMKPDQVSPSASAWGALLGACRIHGNAELGELAAKQVLSIEPCNAATYIMLSDLYVVQGRRQEAGEVLALMRERGVKKQPGCSWIEIKDSVHVFLAGDSSHPQIVEVYSLLSSMDVDMKMEMNENHCDFLIF